MIIAVDIGNSNVVLGFHDGESWVDNWRMPTIKDNESTYFYNVNLRARLLESEVDVDQIDHIILSTVVPSLRAIFKEVLADIFRAEVVLVGPELYEALSFEVPRPYEIGTDLVSNAYSAYKRFGKDCIVVDFGTALTFTTVSEKGYVQGVAIAPGIKTAMKALASNTAQLPEIPLELPESALGQNTTHAMQAGILWGYVGMARQVIAQIRQEVGDHYVAVATGGLSFVMAPLEGLFVEIDRDLTLNGLKYMLEDYLALEV